VSKKVAEIATPRLYESIVIHADEMLALDDLNHKIELCCNDNAKFIKHICLRAPLHCNLRKRCPHYDSDMPERLGDGIDMDDGSDVCLSDILLFSLSLKDANEFVSGGFHESRSILGFLYGTQ
jgi:hypothetical protein